MNYAIIIDMKDGVPTIMTLEKYCSYFSVGGANLWAGE